MEEHKHLETDGTEEVNNTTDANKSDRKKNASQSEENTSQEEVLEQEDELKDEEDLKIKTRLRTKIILAVIGCVFIVVLSGYGGMAYYFTTHFYPGTKINSKDCSYKTVKEVEQYFEKDISDYLLVIRGIDGFEDVIKSQDVGMKYDQLDEIKKIIKAQNPFIWPSVYLNHYTKSATVNVKYDEMAMKKIIDGLHAITVEQVPSKSAKPEFDGDKYEITPEVIGTEIEREVLEKEIISAILEKKDEINLKEAKCYKSPRFTKDSKEVIDACNLLNQYIQTEVTYLIPEKTIIDKTIISSWLSVDDNMQVKINDDAIKEWLRNYGLKYDTIGAKRHYTAPSGKEVEVSGGTYGWSVDEKQEAVLLKEHIEKGEKVQRDPVFVQKAASSMPQDFGNTYIDIDLSMQRMWYVQDGNVVIDTPVVTGMPTPKKVTPTGVFSVLEKELNKTLIGEIVKETGKPEYKVPVSFWIRVTWSGIGIHDTSYRSNYGGSIYETDGSHGCINTPYTQVQNLYNMVSVGTPVSIHY